MVDAGEIVEAREIVGVKEMAELEEIVEVREIVEVKEMAEAEGIGRRLRMTVGTTETVDPAAEAAELAGTSDTV